MAPIILVTGGSGFVGSHVVLQLLNAGYTVRTTMRSATREQQAHAMMERAGARLEALTFARADLEDDTGWREAVSGCEYVVHVASPIPAAAPKTEDELIRPARDGTLRVLRAARDAGRPPRFLDVVVRSDLLRSPATDGSVR